MPNTDRDNIIKYRKWMEKILDKYYLVVGKDGTVYVNTDKEVTKKQLKVIAELIEVLNNKE